jgi:hypothetical protein
MRTTILEYYYYITDAQTCAHAHALTELCWFDYISVFDVIPLLSFYQLICFEKYCRLYLFDGGNGKAAAYF